MLTHQKLDLGRRQPNKDESGEAGGKHRHPTASNRRVARTGEQPGNELASDFENQATRSNLSLRAALIDLQCRPGQSPDQTQPTSGTIYWSVESQCANENAPIASAIATVFVSKPRLPSHVFLGPNTPGRKIAVDQTRRVSMRRGSIRAATCFQQSDCGSWGIPKKENGILTYEASPVVCHCRSTQGSNLEPPDS